MKTAKQKLVKYYKKCYGPQMLRDAIDGEKLIKMEIKNGKKILKYLGELDESHRVFDWFAVYDSKKKLSQEIACDSLLMGINRFVPGKPKAFFKWLMEGHTIQSAMEK